jgi:hypothetical protein
MARARASPRCEVPDGREQGHVKTALGDENLCGVGLHAGDRAQQLDHVLVRGEHELDPFAEILDGDVERVDVRKSLRDAARALTSATASGTITVDVASVTCWHSRSCEWWPNPAHR